MRRSRLHIALFFMTLLLAGRLAAQRNHHPQETGVAVLPVVNVDKNQIVIGEPFHLVIEASVPGASGTPFTWPVLDSIPHFEILEKGGVDTATQSDGLHYKQYLTLTSFDSGAHAIPPLTFICGKVKSITDSIVITMSYSKFDPNADYHDIKDIIDIPNPYAKWIPWIVATVTLLALALVIWLIRKKKILQKLVKGLAPKPRLAPYDEAMHDLDELEKKGITGEGAVKVYYTRLNEILRQFIWRRLQISSVAETNEELINEIRRLPLSPAQFDELAEMLRMSDFVKFAKYQPGTAENEQNLRVTRDSVKRLHTIGQEKEAEAATAAATARGRDNMPKPNKTN